MNLLEYGGALSAGIRRLSLVTCEKMIIFVIFRIYHLIFFSPLTYLLVCFREIFIQYLVFCYLSLCLFQFVFAFSINMAPPVTDPSHIEFSWLLMGLFGALFLVLRRRQWNLISA